MFSFLWSLICYQSIYKYHVINRETRNSKGDFQYFLPLSTGLCSYLPAASNNEKIVQTFCSFSLRAIRLGYGIVGRSIRGGKKKLCLGTANLGSKKVEKFCFSGTCEKWNTFICEIYVYFTVKMVDACSWCNFIFVSTDTLFPLHCTVEKR